MSKGGKPIIALPSTAKNGTVSKIVPFVSEGGGVVTSRGDVHYVVTEYGIASLRGKSIRERALELIRIAHPKFRESLLKQVREHYRVPEYQVQQPIGVPELGEVELKKLTLADISCCLRPLCGTDERHLQEFFYSHNKDTLSMRYNYQPTRMSRETSASLVAVNQAEDLALCIVDNRGEGEEILAVGRYYYISSTNEAEVAFVVREAYQGKGMASVLLEWMITVAAKRGLDALSAVVRPDNLQMKKVLERHGFIIRNRDEYGEMIMALNLKQ
jgi:RimJ/RimL family protein N-acetyltransferase